MNRFIFSMIIMHVYISVHISMTINILGFLHFILMLVFFQWILLGTQFMLTCSCLLEPGWLNIRCTPFLRYTTTSTTKPTTSGLTLSLQCLRFLWGHARTKVHHWDERYTPLIHTACRLSSSLPGLWTPGYRTLNPRLSLQLSTRCDFITILNLFWNNLETKSAFYL